jgi:hypothetical protein
MTSWTQRGLQAAVTWGIGTVMCTEGEFKGLCYRWSEDKKNVYIGIWSPGKSLAPFVPVLTVSREEFVRDRPVQFSKAMAVIKKYKRPLSAKVAIKKVLRKRGPAKKRKVQAGEVFVKLVGSSGYGVRDVAHHWPMDHTIHDTQEEAEMDILNNWSRIGYSLQDLEVVKITWRSIKPSKKLHELQRTAQRLDQSGAQRAQPG